MRSDPRLSIADLALYLHLLLKTADRVPLSVDGMVVAAAVQFVYHDDGQPPTEVYESALRLREFGYLVDTPMHGPLLLPPASAPSSRASLHAARVAVARLHAGTD